MRTTNTAAHLTNFGVAFTVTVDFQQCRCLISRDVLTDLSHSTNSDLDLLATYYAYHGRINGVARRLVAAGVQGVPVALSIRNFA